MLNLKKWLKKVIVEVLNDVQIEVEMKDGKPVYKAVVKKELD